MKRIKSVLSLLTLAALLLAALPLPESLAATPVVYNGGALSAAYVGVPFTYQISSDIPVTLSLFDGALPPGLSLSGDSITGTPTTEGSYSFNLTASDVDTGDTTEPFYCAMSVDTPTPPAIMISTLSSATRGFSYSSYFYASGESTTMTWQIAAGELPPGLSLSGNEITGTPTTVGSWSFTLRARNVAGYDDRALLLTVAEGQAPAIIAVPLSDAQAGQSTNIILRASGTQSIEWSHTGGTLPEGLTFFSSGNIQGTPATAGSYTFTLTATNMLGSDSEQFTLYVAEPAAPIITTMALPSGILGAWYFAAINSVPTGNSELSVTAGALPPGLSISGSSISGMPTAAGSYTFTVTAVGSGLSCSREYTVQILPPSIPVIQTADAPQKGWIGAYYSFSLSTSGDAVDTWAISGGELPPGLSLSGWSTGASIEGTPTQAGDYTFTVRAENVSGNDEEQYTITIAEPGPPAITVQGMTSCAVNSSLLLSFSAVPALPDTQWSLVSGALPTNISFPTGATGSSTSLYGTATEAGTYTFTVRAQNTYGQTDVACTVVVSGAASGALQITVMSAPATAYVGVNTQFVFLTSVNCLWSVASGQLPAGLIIPANSNTMIAPSFMPVEEGVYTFTIRAQNGEQSASYTHTLTVLGPTAPIISVPNRLPDAEAGVDYATELSASGPGSIQFSVTGLPAGLFAGSGMGNRISGIPQASGEYSVTVTAYSEYGASSKTVSLTVKQTSAPTITTTLLTSYVGEALTQQNAVLTATGGGTKYWTAVSALPAGVTLVSASMMGGADTGYLSGGALLTAGDYRFTLRVDTLAGSDTREVTLRVLPAVAPVFPDVILR